MHTKVFSSASRAQCASRVLAHQTRRVTTTYMVRSRNQLNQQKIAGYLRINLKPRPEWMYGKKARSSSQILPATLSRASSSKRPRAIESSPA